MGRMRVSILLSLLLGGNVKAVYGIECLHSQALYHSGVNFYESFTLELIAQIYLYLCTMSYKTNCTLDTDEDAVGPRRHRTKV